MCENTIDCFANFSFFFQPCLYHREDAEIMSLPWSSETTLATFSRHKTQFHTSLSPVVVDQETGDPVSFKI